MEADHSDHYIVKAKGFQETTKQLKNVKSDIKQLTLEIQAYMFCKDVKINELRKRQQEAYELQKKGEKIEHIGHIGLQIHEIVNQCYRLEEYDEEQLKNIPQFATELSRFTEIQTLTMIWKYEMKKINEDFNPLVEAINNKLTKLKTIEVQLSKVYNENPAQLWMSRLSVSPTVTFVEDK